MAQINDQETAKFVREQIRPLCEASRALKVRIIAMKNKFNGLVNANGSPFQGADNTDTIVEGREAEGVSDLTKMQIVQAFEQLDIVTTLNDEIIERPCVRPLIVVSE